MSDALADITENRLDAAPGGSTNRANTAADQHNQYGQYSRHDLHGKHRGTVAADDREGRREPTGHGRHRRATVTAD